MLRLPVTAVGHIAELLVLQSAVGLLLWPDPGRRYEQGTEGALVVSPAPPPATGDPTDILHRQVQQDGQLARLVGPDDAALLILPPGIQLPERVALELHMSVQDTDSQAAADDADCDCPCPNMTPEEVAAFCF